jgi:16S rRNA processing protein RimM
MDDTTSARSPVASRLICLGEIFAAHGVKGEVKIRSYCEDPADLASYGMLQDDAGNTYKISVTSAVRTTLVARIKGVADRDAAEALAKAKTKLYVERAQLGEAEDGRHFIEDLKGLSALDENGVKLATVTSVVNYGAGDILVLQPVAEGKEYMLPLKAPFADKIDIKAGTLQIMVPENWLDPKKK